MQQELVQQITQTWNLSCHLTIEVVKWKSVHVLAYTDTRHDAGIICLAPFNSNQRAPPAE